MADSARETAPDRFAIPDSLAVQGYGLRPEDDGDLPFLRALYATTRERELALLPWKAEQKAAFVDQQFDAQRYHYRKFFPNTAFDVIEYRGAPIGRLYVDVRATHIHLIDIALLPTFRGRGLGTALLKALQDVARARLMGVALFVDVHNPAQRLYRRLGFAGIGEPGVQIEMEWLPRGAAPRRTQLKTAW
ncbi:MAG: GNAT family N-acetyltransferase [Proteobacteria bacterium]|nr:GNAT family N-acetyltransferase [Pseudomonadota bacterium]